MSNRVIRLVIVALVIVLVAVGAKCAVDAATVQFTEQINALFSIDSLA